MAKQIVIVGGGFSGTAVAVHLLRQGDAHLSVTLIEPRALLAEGVAYSTRDPAHRINVPASRMHLLVGEEGDFDSWYRQTVATTDDPDARWTDGSFYPQRNQFARYIRAKLVQAQQSSPVRFRHIQSKAVALERGQIVTENGEKVAADAIVLAISHPPPAGLGITELQCHPRVISNPWSAGALDAIARSDTVTIVGSGLSMADVVASLAQRGHQGQITAFSRRGLLPRSNLSGEYPDWLLSDDLPKGDTALAWLQRVRADITGAAERGIPWQKVLDTVRAQGQQIWQRFSEQEQRRFQRHLRPWWDVHRYRIAPQVNAVLTRQQQDDQLRVLAARLQSIQPQGNQLDIRLRLRQGGENAFSTDWLVTTTGPASGGLLQSDRLLAQLAAGGRIQADPLGMGILVDAQSQVINRAGESDSTMIVAGPAARGRFGELMGLPQVSEHAHKVALALLKVCS